MSLRERWIRLLKPVLKLGLTALALVIVFRQIDGPATLKIMTSSHWIWFAPALVLFNASKIVASLRLNRFFRASKLFLTELENLRLYYVGMFYNLFLPGGIGGDGYKAYLLTRTGEISLKRTVGLLLYDRISGVSALFFFIFVLGIIVLAVQLGAYVWLFPAALILLYPCFYLFSRFLFPYALSVFWPTSMFSLGVQCLQLVCSLCILRALSVEDLNDSYLLLFFVSSIAAALPLTIGGVGARELVFVFGSRYLGTDENTAVAFSIIFFIITAMSSLAGAFIDVNLTKSQT